MMTEDEAKTKWCCGPPQVAAQMMGEPVKTGPARCAGSLCMAWRTTGTSYWGIIRKDGTRQRVPSGQFVPLEEGDETRELWDFGYCGLAGRPHA